MAVEEDWNINMSIYMYVEHQGLCVVTIEPHLASGMSYRRYTRHCFADNKMSFRLLRAGRKSSDIRRDMRKFVVFLSQTRQVSKMLPPK
jgi:hypothetical protein